MMVLWGEISPKGMTLWCSSKGEHLKSVLMPHLLWFASVITSLPLPFPPPMPLRLQSQTRCPSKVPYQSAFSLLHLCVFSLFFLSICKIYRGTGWYDGRTLGSGAPQIWIWILGTNVPVILGFPWQYLSFLRLFSSTVRDNRNIIWLSEAWE